MIITILLTSAGILIMLLLFYRFYFLRDPERKTPKGNHLISPADGKIITITPYTGGHLTIDKGRGKVPTSVKEIGQEGHIISIFMSIFDVHINRAPTTGTIIETTWHKGRFHNAGTSKATLENEHCAILIKGKITIKVLLIAGLLARRIKIKIKKGDKITAGERIGMITLGSQATLIIPSSVKITAKIGDRVKAGETILGQLT